MRYNNFIKGITSLLITLVMAAAFTGCKSEPLPTPPAPSLAVSPTVTAIPTPAATTPAASGTTTAPVETMTPVEVEELAVISNNININFPDEIIFSVEAKSQAIIEKITLNYGSDQRSLAPETSSSEPEFIKSKEVSTSWTWKMKKTGSIPPGATIWWEWDITDVEGNTVSTERQSSEYRDTRFQWTVKEYSDYKIYWYDQSDRLINELLAGIQTRLARIELDVQIPEERKPKVYIYTSSEELKGAILFEQEWTGALAYPSFNIILSAVNDDILDWAKDALPHEITHLLVGELIFGPFSDIPTWLDEGLAQYTELEMQQYKQKALNTAISQGILIPISSLSGNFPTSGTSATLAYAESSSIVSFLIEEYGWEKIQLLLATFKDGATSDQALMTVYSFSVDELEKKWKSHIGAK